MPAAGCGSIPALEIEATVVMGRASVRTPASDALGRRRDRVEVAVPFASPTSQELDRRHKNIADATLGLDERWRVRVQVQFAAQPQNLHVDAAIENIFVYARRLE